MHDATGNTIWLYDAYGRVTKEVRELANSLGTYEIGYSFYSNSDLMRSIIYPTGEEVFTGYDNRKLPTKVYLGQVENPTHYLAGGTGTTSSLARYDQVGRLTSLPMGNGLTTSYTYNPVNGNGVPGEGSRLHSIQVGSFLNLSYSYDPNGNILSITDLINSLNQLTNFTYDGINRLTSAVAAPIIGVEGYTQSYDFDQTNGRMTTKTENGTGVIYAYDVAHPHAATSMGGNSYVYDGRGNMTQRSENGITYNQHWTLENKLKKVTWTQAGDHVTTFVYDADGNRVLQIQRITLGSTSREVTTIYIGGIYEVQQDTSSKNSGAGLTSWYSTRE